MKQLFILSLSLLSFVSSRAQVKLEDYMKPGTRLVYAIDANGSKYDFVVTIVDPRGASFDWEMGRPADMHGTIIHSLKALKEGYIMYNYFASETKKLDDKTLSVWLSQKVFAALTKNTDPVKIGLYDPLDEPVPMKCFSDGEFNIKINGNGYKMTDKVVRAAKKGKDKWIVDQTNQDYFSYYNSATCPIILRMQNKFTLVLKEIKTN